MPPDRSGFSAADDIREKLGRGYTGKGSTKSKGLSKLASSNSKLKKKIAVAGAAAGGSLILGVIVFLAMLPLKIDMILQNIDQTFGAATSQAMGDETDRLLSGWIKREVLPALKTGTCTSTISPNCTLYDSKTGGPVGKLYASWRKNKLDLKLASDYGMVIGRDSSGHPVMNLAGERPTRDAKGNLVMKLGGSTVSLEDLQNGNKNLFELKGTSRVSSAQIKAEIDKALDGETKWKAAFKRYTITKKIDKHFGTYTHCLVVCDTREKLQIKLSTAKLGAKLWIIQRVIAPRFQSTGMLLTCIQDPNSCTGGRNANEKIAQATEEFMNTPGNTENDLNKLVGMATDINKLGFIGAAQKLASQKLVGALAGEAAGDTAGQLAEKAVPVIGWVTLGVSIVAGLAALPHILPIVSYASNAQAAAQLYTTYKVADDEMHSGNTDAGAYGSLWDALGPDSDLGTTHSDATSTPVYQQVIAGNTSDVFTSAASIFGSDASPKDTYLCNDKKPVPAGQLVCDEENFSKTNSSTINSLSGNSAVQATSAVLHPIAKAVNAPGVVLGKVVGSVCNVPIIHQGCTAAGSTVQKAVGSATDKLIPNPFADLSGGRTSDMIIAGGDVTNNGAAQQALGSKKLTPTQVSIIRNQQTMEAKNDFDSKPLFARMFSTSTPYSFVSRLAVAMPVSFAGFQDKLSSLLVNPLRTLGNSFASLFSSNRAFAADTPQADPFGVNQYGYTQSDLDATGNDPADFWAKNCAVPNSPYGTYDAASETFDASSWLDNDDIQHFDDTGQSTTTQTNPCLLIFTSIQSVGALSDPSLLGSEAQ